MNRLLILFFSIFISSCGTPINNDAKHNRQEVNFYIKKLADPSYIEPYGDAQEPKVWYIAAETLGAMGAPAIPELVGRLSTNNSYELMLVLYALMLATQDPVVLETTHDDYLLLDTVLTPETNAENLQRAIQWCQNYPQICYESPPARP